MLEHTAQHSLYSVAVLYATAMLDIYYDLKIFLFIFEYVISDTSDISFIPDMPDMPDMS